MEVQSTWEMEAEWTLPEEKAVWRSNQHGISRENGLWHTGKSSGGPISKKFQVRLDFRRENTDSEVQSACLKRYKMLVRVHDTYR